MHKVLSFLSHLIYLDHLILFNDFIEFQCIWYPFICLIIPL